ncbi:MAG: CopG family antitoxin [Bacillota bacterium]
MARKAQEEPLPAFESAEQEAAFWDSHSVADYWDQLEPATETVEVVRKKRLLSVRLAQHDDRGVAPRRRPLRPRRWHAGPRVDPRRLARGKAQRP